MRDAAPHDVGRRDAGRLAQASSVVAGRERRQRHHLFEHIIRLTARCSSIGRR
jgi:hypothetical protein